MHMPQYILRLAFAVIAFIAVAPLSAADENRSAQSETTAESDYGQLVTTISIPSTRTPAEVRRIIVGALIGREWTVQDEDEGKVVGHLKHRRYEGTVTFIYSDSAIQMYCVGWLINRKTGERVKPRLPSGWLQNLERDIRRIL